MSIAGVSASGTTAAYQQRPQGPGKEIREGVNALKSAIESGDLDAAKEAYETLSELADQRKTGSGTETSKDPLSSMLESVGAALETGDIAAAQEAFSAAGPKGAPGGAGGRPPGPPPGEGPSEEVVDAMGGLAQSLQSGDLDAAQESYSALTELLESSQTTSTASAEDRFKSAFADLGSALESGNLATAQQIFSALAPRGSQGVDVYV